MNANNVTRVDVYAAIKANGLQNECVKRFGKNFTMCKTADLIALVNEKSASKPAPAAPVEEPMKEAPVEKEEVAKDKKEETQATTEYADVKVKAALSKLVSLLGENGTLEDNEVEEVENILGGKVEVGTSEDYKPTSASPYSDDEIDRMFDFAR